MDYPHRYVCLYPREHLALVVRAAAPLLADTFAAAARSRRQVEPDHAAIAKQAALLVSACAHEISAGGIYTEEEPR